MSMRTSAPKKGNKYYTTVASGGYNDCIQGKVGSTGRPYECDALANCVGYVSGRINEFYAELFGVEGRHFSRLNCNAENFIERGQRYGLKVSDVPVKGGIMVWQKGTLEGSDGAGHVAFVEDFDGKTAYTSESGYNSTVFYNSKRTNANGRWGSGSAYKYRGCLYSEEIVAKLKEIEEASKPKEEPKKEEPKKVEVKQIIHEGDIVIVNGVGTADSYGKGAHTKRYVDRKMKVIKVIDGRTNGYALNQYASGSVGDMTVVTAWFNINDIKKV